MNEFENIFHKIDAFKKERAGALNNGQHHQDMDASASNGQDGQGTLTCYNKPTYIKDIGNNKVGYVYGDKLPCPSCPACPANKIMVNPNGDKLYIHFLELAAPGFNPEKNSPYTYFKSGAVNMNGVAIIEPGVMEPIYRHDWQAAISYLQKRYGKNLEKVTVIVENAHFAGMVLSRMGINPPDIIDARWLGRYVFGNRPGESLSELYSRCGGMSVLSAKTVGAESFALSAVTALRHSAEYLLPRTPVHELAVIRQTAANAQSPSIQVDVVALKQLQKPELKVQYPHIFRFVEHVLGCTGSNGLLHILLDYGKAVTGRFSAAKGCVIHGIPRLPATTAPGYAEINAVLTAIKATPGFCFVSADVRAIEPRVFAFLAGAEQLYADLIGGIDIYSSLAGAVFGNSGIATGTLRQIGKRTFIAFTYGIGTGSLYERLADEPALKALVDGGVITRDSCARLLSQLKADYPQVTRYGLVLEDAVRNAYAAGTAMFGTLQVSYYAGDAMVIMLPSGRQLSYYGFTIDGNGQMTYTAADGKTKTLYSSKLAQNLIQGVARDLLVNALCSVKGDLAFHVHDQIVCCVQEQEIETCKQLLRAAWCTPPAWLPGFQLAVEVKAGRNLTEMEKITGSDKPAGT
jgi:hypothetical protein